MATVMLVADRHAGEPVVGPDVAERLAGLGITRITLLRDRSSIAVVLEGWAFDPAHIDEAVQVVFPTGGSTIRILHEIERVAVTVADRTKEV